MAVNYGLLEPVDIAGQFMAGRQQAQQNQLAQQQAEMRQQEFGMRKQEFDAQAEDRQLKLADYKTKQAGLDKFLELSVANGKTGSPKEMAGSFYEYAITQRDPQLIMSAQTMMQAADEREKYDAISNRQQPIPAQQTPAPMADEFGTGTALPGMFNALAQRAAPMASTNALAAPKAADPVAAIDSQIALYENLKDPRAKDKVARLQKQRDELTKLYPVGGNLVSGTGKKVFTADAAPTDVKKLIMERDALPLGSPNRVIYDQQIKDLGATAQAARDRLTFDRQKFDWEKSNPGFDLIQNESGEYFAVDKKTRAMTPLMVGGAAPAAAAPAASAVATPAGGVPVGRTAPAAGVPFVGKGVALNESQSNATAFGMRMKEANSLLTDLENKGETNTGIIGGATSGLVGLVPFIGDKLSAGVDNIFNVLPSVLGGYSPEQQQVLNGRINFITAILRKESGAAISPQEFATAEKLYFPQPGDDKKVIKQKQRARDLAVEAMKVQAGPGAKSIDKLNVGGAGTQSANDPLGLR